MEVTVFESLLFLNQLKNQYSKRHILEWQNFGAARRRKDHGEIQLRG